ncbi:MAG: phosphate acetyltransferase [Deltaproteobacteria bacterium]|jgi:phosphate acetyltransferase|nr:phosphate acetyltransferase [Deltaproteobacteria bacterium]
MAMKVYFAATDPGVNKSRVVRAFFDYCQKSLSGQVGYFQPLAAFPDSSRRDSLAPKIGLEPRDLYGLTTKEAIKLLNANDKAAVIEEVLTRFEKVAAKSKLVLIEGGDCDPQATFELQGLGAELAANLAAPVLFLGGVDPEMSASAVRIFQERKADILGVAYFGGDLENLKASLAPFGVDVKAAKLSDLESVPASWEAAIQGFQPKVVTPKRFEFDLISRAKSNKQKIVLPEGDDERILLAADNILRRDFADLVILGEVEAIQKIAKEKNLRYLEKAELVNLKTAPFRQELVDQFYELRKAKGVTPEKAEAQLNDRNWFGTMMVKAKKASGMVSGAAGTTADTIRPALSIIKTKPGCSIASSVFLMCLADKVLVFGDCAINTNPTPPQIAEIAVISAQTAKAFGVNPLVALLSYSTGTSGTGPDVDAIHEATALAKEAAAKFYPGLPIDGPMQFDAALDPKTAKGKMPGSPVAGQATVLIFPSLNAGNIGYKAVQRTSGAVAIGPIIQGLNSPVNDLSRGCTVPDIINTVAITAAQAQ